MTSLERPAIRNLLLAGIFVLAFTFFIRAIAPGPSKAPDYDGSTRGEEVVVHIEAGMSGSEVGTLLESKDVVKSSLAYFRAAVAEPKSERIAPGEHRIESRISAKEAVAQLLDAVRIVNLVKVRDGARLEEIMNALVAAGFSVREVNTAIKNIKPPTQFKSQSLEGVLYPAFYSFDKSTNADRALQSMLDKFNFMTSKVSWRYEKFSPQELLTIASLVETEGTPDIFSKVARVIYNRLDVGMKLQFDSTVHYIFTRRGEIALSIKDTQVKNPYNTFLYVGLPPTPIGSPTIKAIEATLNPASGDWLYFVTVLPGETRFTASYDEFLRFKAEYKRNYQAGKFE